MTDTNDPRVSPTIETRRPGDLPLKAERIQWFLFGLDLGNHPYDFANETEAERNARLEAGWRKRTSGARSVEHGAA